MRAPYRRTVPWTPLPVAVNPSRRNVSRSDLQAVGDQGGAGVVMQLRPLTDEVADVGAAQIHHAHVVDVGGEPVAQIYALIDLQGVVGQGGAGVFAQFCPLTHEVADLRAGPALQYPADVLPPSAVPARRHHGRLRCVRYSASRDGRNARARRRLHRPQIRDTQATIRPRLVRRSTTRQQRTCRSPKPCRQDQTQNMADVRSRRR